jgi:hypothetical protein
MQSTTRLHESVANAVLQEACLVVDNPIAFHPPHGVCDADSDRRPSTMGCCRWWGEVTTAGVFLRVDEGDLVEEKTLTAPLLVEATAAWQGLAVQSRQAVSMPLAVIRRTQETHMTGRSAHEPVVDRGALLLTPVRVLVRFGSCRALERPRRTLLPTRGDVDSPFAWGVLRQAAQSSAVRAGSRS